VEDHEVGCHEPGQSREQVALEVLEALDRGAALGDVEHHVQVSHGDPAHAPPLRQTRCAPPSSMSTWWVR
jgi:hypothetical protein